MCVSRGTIGEMKILVTGGTGKVGRETIPLLHAGGHDAISASRGGEGGIALDLHDVDAVARAGAGHDAALLIMPLGEDEEALGPRVVEALTGAGVGRIVAIGIHNAAAMAEIPHFAAKLPMQAAVVAGGGTVLACNWFQQNDLNVLGAIVGGGAYVLPIGSGGVWAVDTADIAAAAVNALTSDDWRGQEVVVCGPEHLTGSDMAANWAAALGRPVQYAGDAVDPFIAGMKAAYPDLDDWLEADFRIMMRITQRDGNLATPAEVAESEAIVGRPLTSHRDFALRTATAMENRS